MTKSNRHPGRGTYKSAQCHTLGRYTESSAVYHEKRAINYHDRGTNTSASSPLNPWLHLGSVSIEAEDLRHSFGTVEIWTLQG